MEMLGDQVKVNHNCFTIVSWVTYVEQYDPESNCKIEGAQVKETMQVNIGTKAKHEIISVGFDPKPTFDENNEMS